MIRNLFLVLSNLGSEGLTYVFSFLKIPNKFLSLLSSLLILGLIAFLTRNTEFSIFNADLSMDKITLWVSVVLGILSNHNDTNKEQQND